jgi:WD40 repeat protein
MAKTDNFSYDVFLSHTAKDKVTVLSLAERLKKDGLNVWLDAWLLKPGDNILHKIEQGLDESRVLVLCMSANAYESDWTRLESYTFRFRDPLNHERRFIPLRLDDAPVRGALSQFVYVDWNAHKRESEYAKLLEACRAPAERTKPTNEANTPQPECRFRDVWFDTWSADIYAIDTNGEQILSASSRYPGHYVVIWNPQTGGFIRALNDAWNSGAHVFSLAVSPAQESALSGASDGTIWLWNLRTGKSIRALLGHHGAVTCLAWSSDSRYAISGSDDRSVRLWDINSGLCLRVFEGHTGSVRSVSTNNDQSAFLSGGADNTVRLWNLHSGDCARILEGHVDSVHDVAWIDSQRALSASADRTMRLWDAKDGTCLRVLEGHTAGIQSVSVAANQQYVLSGSLDRTVRVWDVETGNCVRVLEDHDTAVVTVAWSPHGEHAFATTENALVRIWDLTNLSSGLQHTRDADEDVESPYKQIQYTNAKVLLVGDTGAGKTGLAMRLARHMWEPSDSTVGAWATHWKLPAASNRTIEREIWLWDFGGQADQRLIHQLYMDETALAVLVFDGQKEDLFEILAEWDRDLTRGSRREFAKLLVAGRVDAGGLRVSRPRIEAFAREHRYTQFLETSAKADIGCVELRQAILHSIPWKNIPWRSSPVLFKRLKEEIVKIKDAGRVINYALQRTQGNTPTAVTTRNHAFQRRGVEGGTRLTCRARCSVGIEIRKLGVAAT